jgi:hypothetical protein
MMVSARLVEYGPRLGCWTFPGDELMVLLGLELMEGVMLMRGGVRKLGMSPMLEGVMICAAGGDEGVGVGVVNSDTKNRKSQNDSKSQANICV